MLEQDNQLDYDLKEGESLNDFANRMGGIVEGDMVIGKTAMELFGRKKDHVFGFGTIVDATNDPKIAKKIGKINPTEVAIIADNIKALCNYVLRQSGLHVGPQILLHGYVYPVVTFEENGYMKAQFLLIEKTILGKYIVGSLQIWCCPKSIAESNANISETIREGRAKMV